MELCFYDRVQPLTILKYSLSLPYELLFILQFFSVSVGDKYL
jgi:hypothetical protein